MNPDELIKTGNVAEAIASLNKEVRDNPQDTRRRTMLFEMLCVAGEWQRAAHALAAMAEQNVEIAEGVVPYRKLLVAEEKRRQFLRGGAAPGLPLGVAVLAPYLAAVQSLAEGNLVQAEELLMRAEAERKRPTGAYRGARFGDLRDADDRFAAVLEVLLGEDYLWLPLSELHTLRVYPPRHLRDMIFAPAMVDWGQGPRPVFLPVRYPDSERDARSEVQLARQTTTRQEFEALVLCLGQRVLLIGDQQVPLLDVDLLTWGGGERDGQRS